jgi:hypothetical protein
LKDKKGRTTPDYINISSFEKDRDKDSDLDISKEDYYKASTMFYQRFTQSGRESILMSPISFSESNTSKTNESVGQSFTEQDWGDVGLPVPDQASLARTASRRSLKRMNPPSIEPQKDPNDSIKTDFKLEKREDGDGVDEYSVKYLLKKFNENENKGLKLNLNQSESHSYNGEVHKKQNCVSYPEKLKPHINSNFHLKSYASDSEILDNNSAADEETNTTRSAPIMLSPLSCVLADLRKTADVRKEKLYSLSRSQPSMTKPKVDEVIVTKGALQLIDNNSITNCKKQTVDQSDYLNMEKVVKDEDEYVAMDGEVEKESDAADDADDEASRDFDTINYQSEVIAENDIKLKAGCKVRTYKKPRPEPVPIIANSYQHLSHIAKELLNPNPAYETFDEIRVGNDTEVKCVSVEANNDSSDKQRSPNAPYYYSDLLSEEQQIALQERLAACQSGSPPPLLSRCNALNNTRFLGTTSLQKTDIGKRVNNIVNSINKNDSSISLNNAIIQTDIENSLKSILLPNVSKFLDSERNKYEAGHTLEKVPDGDKSFSYLKRCMTPDISHFKTRKDLEFQTHNSSLENTISSRRRSKSLEGLVDQQNKYENIGQQSINDFETYNNSNSNDNNFSDDDFIGTEALRRVSKRHFADNFNSKASPINQHNVPLVERLEKSFDDYTETESDLSSLIELSIGENRAQKSHSCHQN